MQSIAMCNQLATLGRPGLYGVTRVYPAGQPSGLVADSIDLPSSDSLFRCRSSGYDGRNRLPIRRGPRTETDRNAVGSNAKAPTETRMPSSRRLHAVPHARVVG